MKVREIMTTDVVTATLDTPFKRLAELMVTRCISGIPVVDDDGHVLGLVTEGDLIAKAAFRGKPRRGIEVLLDLLYGERLWVQKAQGATAADVMTAPAVAVDQDESVPRAARLLLTRGIKRLPVVTGGRLVGIVSRRDVLGAYIPADAAIRADVDEMLHNPRYIPEDADVVADVHDGVVTLEGTVREPRDLELVAHVIGHHDGVVAVESHLTAREPEVTNR